jgi:S1-C subfamily serine protease
MILSNVIFRTFFIKAEMYGTAFALDIGESEYLITARHLLDKSKNSFVLKLFMKEKWLDIPATVVGHGRGDVDISVLKLPNTLAGPKIPVKSTTEGLVLGQDVYFLGFPYKMWGHGGDATRGRPLPFAKKGIVSSIDFANGQLYIDAFNNEGFSGGPLFFYPLGKNFQEVIIAGVVSKFRTEYEPVLNSELEKTDMTIPYNTGFLIAHKIEHALNIIS